MASPPHDTLRAALESISARQLRLMFVLQAWERPMTFGDQVGVSEGQGTPGIGRARSGIGGRVTTL